MTGSRPTRATSAASTAGAEELGGALGPHPRGGARDGGAQPRSQAAHPGDLRRDRRDRAAARDSDLSRAPGVFIARENALGRRHEPVLHHDRDPLRQRRAAYRPRLRAHRHRRDPALHAARRPRDAVRHRHGRIRPQGSAGGGARRRDAAGFRRPGRRGIRGDGRAAQRPRRRHRAHDAAPQRPRRAGDLGAHGRQRRHLSLEIFRLVFGARRGLFRRERTERRARGDEARARAARRSSGSRRRASSSACRPTPTGSSPITRPIPNSSRRKNTATRSSPSSSAGSSDLSISRANLQLGRAGARRSEARDVCLGRRADQLHHRDRLPRRRPAREILAGRRACDRQGHHPLPRDLLAGVPDVGRAPAAAADRRARLSVQPRREDVEVGRQCREPGRVSSRPTASIRCAISSCARCRSGRTAIIRTRRSSTASTPISPTTSAIWRNAR